MKIDVRPVIKNYEGREIRIIDEKGEDTGPMTVRLAFNRAINGIEVVETPRGRVQKILTEEEKGKTDQLARKLWDAKKRVNFTVDEAAFIKNKAGKVAGITPLIYGVICDLLEGKNEESAKPEENTGEGEPVPGTPEDTGPFRGTRNGPGPGIRQTHRLVRRANYAHTGRDGPHHPHYRREE